MSEEKELNDVLGISEESPKSSGIFDKVPESEQEPSTLGDNAAEAVLSIVAYAILILGILASIITGYEIGSHGYNNEGQGFLIFLGGTITLIITWAACMVIVNISNNVRQIKHELRNK